MDAPDLQKYGTIFSVGLYTFGRTTEFPVVWVGKIRHCISHLEPRALRAPTKINKY